MQSYRGSHRCNITADDADNGESPRLAYCFSCCNKQECSKLCEVYHNRECQQLRFAARLDVLRSYPRDAMLAPVLAMTLCRCVSVSVIVCHKSVFYQK